jgi:hypothetical protein
VATGVGDNDKSHGFKDVVSDFVVRGVHIKGEKILIYGVRVTYTTNYVQ